jgi:hypothetical protein
MPWSPNFLEKTREPGFECTSRAFSPQAGEARSAVHTSAGASDRVSFILVIKARALQALASFEWLDIWLSSYEI